MPEPRITVVVAAAGAGKTTRIVHSIAETVKTRAPEEIVATTFTVKAANELVERARAYLTEVGQADIAARLLGARFGTVNAICGHFAAEYALELGRSPSTEVIPEEQVARVFSIAAAEVIARHAPALHSLGTAFGFDEPVATGESPEWRDTVRRIIELARANGIGRDGLARSAERSVETFLALLPSAPEGCTSEALDAALNEAVAAAMTAISEACSATATDSVALLRRIHAAARAGRRHAWPDWARLSKVKCAKKDGQALVGALDEVKRAAQQHPYHPQLRRDCERFIRTLFACAAEALGAYQAYKAERGLLDFVDQETLALEVLQNPALAARLGERIGCVFIDEFQDSSPLQVAIFRALAEIADASMWVGDPKQAIYGFRNADTTLTQAAFHGVMAASEEPPVMLSTSYRSRHGIVALVNATFEPAMTAMGLPPAQHAFTGTSRSDDAFSQAPCAVWWLEGNGQQRAAALAGGVRDVLATGDEWVVDDRNGGVRHASAGEIAILCRSNSEVAGIAAALSRLGVKVAVARDGLVDTPHVQLVMAAIRWTIDPSDRLALAELARFFAEDAVSDRWLRAVSAEEPDEALRAAVPISGVLVALREQLLALTPAELVDAVITLPGVMALVARWGGSATRLDDLEALRGAVRTYETTCASSGDPATPSGFVLALLAAKPGRPKSLQPDAVTVMTYHAAKGLEWPIVILTSLDRAPRPRLFEEPVAEVETAPDWRDPLAGRWLRYWPWPYASQRTDVGLDQSALITAIGQSAVRRASEEDARLFYVGVTRARDYVIFAPPATKIDPQWLRVLDGPEQPQHVVLPSGDEPVIHAGNLAIPARVSRLIAGDETRPSPVRQPFVQCGRSATVRPPLHRRPSDERTELPFAVAARIELGPRLTIVGDPDMAVLGTAVHAVLAADVTTWGRDERLARASAILTRWGVHEIMPHSVIDAADRLNDQLRTMWPAAHIRREVPIHAHVGAQLVRGRIDLLVEDSDGFAVIDHKSFPGSRDRWEAHAVAYGPQLRDYAQAIVLATGKPCRQLYVHLPIVGALLEVAPRPLA